MNFAAVGITAKRLCKKAIEGRLSMKTHRRTLRPVVLTALGVIVLAAAGFGFIFSRGESAAGARAKSLSKQGSQLREAGRYAEARPVLQEALTLAESAFGPDSFETAAVL